ncbi:liver merozoite formation protein, putative [Plasmodium malariae]|uniref:Liver merozoite formation protein, putative n=1 Tax=Plasmodium malariae TaxID=5858 RepID=A0A1C3L057_PLAMA|nr:liver merozoite formation protein, putative [Plasmodium malariae]
MKLLSFNLFMLAFFFFVLTMSLCKKVLFIDILNGINVNYNKKKYINKNMSYNHENVSQKTLFVSKNEIQTSIANEESCTLDDDKNENILKQYIYTLSHLTIFDIDREKDIPLNISLLLKACLASHNYIKNVEIYTSDVKNKNLCSFIYENRENFESFFNLHVLKYLEFFDNPNIEELLKSYIDEKSIYENEFEIYKKIDKNTTLKKDILLDILFECLRLNKIIQYSLAINKFNVLSYHIMLKIFAYFKSNGIYYYIFLHNINKIKYYYSKKNIKEEDKNKIYQIVDYYLHILNYMNTM